MPVPILHTGAARVVYERRDEAPFHFASVYYVERRQERGKAPEEIVRRLVLTQLEAFKLAEELKGVFYEAKVGPPS